MNIETVRGMFSQFSDGIDVKASDGGAAINAHIEKKELADFALRLMDVADDCLRRLGYDVAQGLLDETQKAIYEARAQS